MADNRHQLLITIGAALSGGFSSVISGSTSKIKELGSAIKDLDRQSVISAASIDKLKVRYNSLLGSINKQQGILAKRGMYRSQIMDVVALGASLAAPINSAMKFESAMADVGKVVDFETSEGLKQLGKSLKELSRTIPLSVEGLAQITAAGGQLGVKEKDLISFTTNVAKMSTAFDMLPDEAGKSMATLSNVFDIPITELTALGDAINHISNNSAAAARGIVPALAKVGGAARQFGLSAEQTSALVGTLIAMGRAPEEAGTATAAILQRLQLADKLGPKAEKAFRKIGISAKVFGKMIAEDAQGALTKFFNAVEKIQGQERAGVLVDIFGKNYSSTVATIIGSLGKYKDQLQLISDPKKYAGSMEKEFTTRAATTENAIQLLKNGISELAIILGDTLLPTVNNIAQSIGSALKSITSWISANPELTRTITHVIGGLIAAKLATFALGYASTFLFGGLNRLVIVFKGLRLGLSLAGVAFKSFLGWPMILAEAGVAVYQNWEIVQKYLQSIWTVVEPYWLQFKSVMDSLGVTQFVTESWSKVQSFFSSIWSIVTPHFNAFLAKIKELGFVDKIISAWNRLKSFFAKLWTEITPNFNAILKPIDGLWSKIKGLMPNVGGLVSGKSTSTAILKIPDVKSMKPQVNRNQNNNFTINIQAAKGDNAESLSQKVMDKVSAFSKTFLYDPVEGVI